ncbi:hypothetical protein MASR2M117_14640 [Paludibacter sp.]
MKKLFTLLSVFVLAIGAQELQATTWYVRLTGSTAWADKPEGLIKTVDPIHGVYNMINAAEASVDTIWIASGTYYLNLMIPALKPNRVVFGGFAGTENAVSDRALADADGNGLVEPWEFANPTIFEPSETMAADNQRAMVLTSASPNTVVDGIIFQNYHNKNTTGIIFINGAPNAKIRNTVLRNSSMTVGSGFVNGIFTVNSGEAINCVVEFCTVENTAETGGGADGAFRIIGNTAGVNSGRAIGCVARGNKVISASPSTGRGGGFAVGSLKNSTNGAALINSIAYNNYASADGGGILLVNVTRDAVSFNVRDSVINCTAVNNVSGAQGAGIAVVAGGYLYNTVAWGNTGAGETATDIAFMNGGTVDTPNKFYVNNITGNYAKFANTWQEDDAVHFPQLTKVVNLTAATSILLADRPSNTDDVVGDPTLYAPKFENPTAFQGRSTSEDGFDAAPTAADTLAIRQANWTPKQYSPLINAGNATYVTISTDLMGEARVQKGKPDLGALETDHTLTGTITNGKLGVTLAQSGNEICLSGIDGRFEVYVYDTNARLIKTLRSNDAVSFSLSNKGVYILHVAIGSDVKVMKVVL